ncbi:hypothetical protein B0H14DRAFT_3734974, partial [Mycena olivaceomarginata]
WFAVVWLHAPCHAPLPPPLARSPRRLRARCLRCRGSRSPPRGLRPRLRARCHASPHLPFARSPRHLRARCLRRRGSPAASCSPSGPAACALAPARCPAGMCHFRLPARCPRAPPATCSSCPLLVPRRSSSTGAPPRLCVLLPSVFDVALARPTFLSSICSAARPPAFIEGSAVARDVLVLDSVFISFPSQSSFT